MLVSYDDIEDGMNMAVFILQLALNSFFGADKIPTYFLRTTSVK